MSFDFIGTSVDESSDDLAVVQIPSNWKTMFVDPLTLQLFFELYQNLPSEVAAQVRRVWHAEEVGVGCTGKVGVGCAVEVGVGCR